MHRLKIILCLLLALVFFSCMDVPLLGEYSNKEVHKTLEDPYSPDNMKRALVALIAKNSGSNGSLKKSAAVAAAEDFSLESNYLYVRFLPKGDAQKRELFTRDPDLVLFDVPMDFRVNADEPTGYLDASLPDSVKPYFAAVPKDYDFGTEIAYEVIKPLFLVQPLVSALDSSEAAADPVLQKVGSATNAKALVAFLQANGLTLQDLETASLELTGNLDSTFHNVLANGIAKRAFWERWRPKGTLKYQDTKLGVQPVVGVRVTAGYSYYWRSSRTNSEGYFSSPERWTYSVKYKAHWDAEDFLLEDNESWYGADLVTEGPTSYQPWNRTFVDQHAVYAAIFTAAYTYYYNPIDGLNRPRQNGWLNFALDLQVSDKVGSNDLLGLHSVIPWVANWITIWTKETKFGVTSYQPSWKVYATTIHELAHSSHFVSFNTRNWAVPRQFEFGSVEDRVKESFAAGMQWWLTRRRYPEYARAYDGKYSGIIEDLIDGYGNFANTDISGDQVQGFTARQVEAAVERSFTWNELRDNLKSMYPSGSGPSYTAASIDGLFSYWASVPVQ